MQFGSKSHLHWEVTLLRQMCVHVRATGGSELECNFECKFKFTFELKFKHAQVGVFSCMLKFDFKFEHA